MKLFFLTTFAIFALDRISKVLAVKLLSGKVKVLIPGLLDLRVAENKGAAFSLLSEGNELVRKFFLIAVPVFVLLGITAYVLKRKPDSSVKFALGLIAGGAMGNLYDRVVYGKVVDFIDFHLGGWHYPTFNVADMAVSLGVLILIIFFRNESVGRN